MIQVLCLIYILMFSVYIFLSRRFHITKTQFAFLWGMFSFALALLAYNMNPPDEFDLVHYQFGFLNQIRYSGMSLVEFLFQDGTTVGGPDYTNLYTFNLLRYFVVSVSKNNFLLPAICVFIDFSIVGYIMADWSMSTKGRLQFNPLVLFLCFSFMPFVHCTSGLRNALCASILSLGIYLYLYKQKNILVFIVFSFMAATVHMAALIAIPFVLLARLKLGWTGYGIVFAFSLLAQYVTEWMATSGIAYFQVVSRKYVQYTSEEQYISSRAPLYTILLLLVIFILAFLLTRVGKRNWQEKTPSQLFVHFLALYMVYILGNFGNYDMVLRPAYVLGPLAPIICSLLLESTAWRGCILDVRARYVIRWGMIVACYALCIYLNYKFFVSYGIYFIG